MRRQRWGLGLVLLMVLGLAAGCGPSPEERAAALSARLQGSWQGAYRETDLRLTFGPGDEFALLSVDQGTYTPIRIRGTYSVTFFTRPAPLTLTLQTERGTQIIYTLVDFRGENLLYFENNYAGAPRPPDFTPTQMITLTRR